MIATEQVTLTPALPGNRLPAMKVFDGYGKAMADLRKRAGMTQAALAESSGVDVKTVSNVERSATSAQLDKLDAILYALGVTVWGFAQAIAQAQGAQIPPEFEAEIRERQRDRFKELVSHDAPMPDDPREKLFRLQQEHIAKLEAALNDIAREARTTPNRPTNER